MVKPSASTVSTARQSGLASRTFPRGAESACPLRKRLLGLRTVNSGQLAIVLLLLGIPKARAATGDDEPPPPEPSRLQPGFLHLRPIDLALEFEGGYENRTVRTEERRGRESTQRNRDTRFEEALRLTLSGDIIDPNFISWDGTMRVGLRQERYREEVSLRPDRSDSSDGLLLDYDLSMDLFPTKPVSGRIYGRQVRDRVPRRFLPSLLEERAEAGVAAYLKLGNLTSEFGFDWSDVERSDNRGRADDEHFQFNRFFTRNDWRISDDQRLRVGFDHTREESRYQGSRGNFTTDRDELRVDHELQFGGPRRHQLDTYFRWSDERGDLARDETEFTPRLLLRHTDRFETAYRYGYYRLDEDAVRLEQHKFDWMGLWRPDERFRLTADAFGLWEDIEGDAETHQFGGGLHASFRTPTRWGKFLAYAAINADQVRTSGSGGARLVRGEGHVLDSSIPTFLNQSDIIPTSVLAYNAGRTRVFVPGQDYLIQQVGRRTLTYRILTGRIGQDEIVYFDYQYRVPLDSRTDTYRVDARVEHEFSCGLTPYYAFELRRQDVSGSIGNPAFEDNTDRHRLGMNFRKPTWSINGEAEFFDDPYEPYNAGKLDVEATLWKGANASADGSARYAYYQFTGDVDSRRVQRVDLDLTGRLRIDPRFQGKLATSFRWEDDTSRGETTGVDVECGLQYRRGQLEIELTVEYDLLSIVNDREDGFGVWLMVRRDLSHWPAGWTRRGEPRVQ